MRTLLPGASVGVIGGGQLGRYFVLEARRMGYDTWVLDPDAHAPAMQIAAHPVVAAYDDASALQQIGEACDAITIEFENIPASSIEQLASLSQVAPSADAVRIAQDRRLEKTRAAELGLQPVPWMAISGSADVDTALDTISLPAILKTATLGYDGKGQHVCHTEDELRHAVNALAGVACVLEQRIELAAECSVVLARGFDGQIRHFPVACNVHVNGILDTSTVPSGLDANIESRAVEQAYALVAGLDYVGVLGVEFFVDTDGALWFNEMAPRPHNSGHYTLDATDCSQFEQQLRAVCALPLTDPMLLGGVCMLNVLGDAWIGGEPDWKGLLGHEGTALHLYGKSEPRAGRKMGHVNCMAPQRDAVVRAAEVARRCIGAER